MDNFKLKAVVHSPRNTSGGIKSYLNCSRTFNLVIYMAYTY